jgi:transcriptional regulator with XRE-family HTH domain
LDHCALYTGRRTPLNPNQLARRAGVRRQLLSHWLNSPAETRLAPRTALVRRFAHAMGRPTSELMALAGYGDRDDPFLDPHIPQPPHSGL